ncbi:mitochondrial import inner membrane translocase subunit tim16-like [Oscarella lobularis]|uniref:mitochondrial import inner membrane translocase subunit tim16-like n=1 Tax=Oscarella lobularis TaxID=121494 RepID=UPI00331376D6
MSFARFIAQVVVVGGQVVARAFAQALRQEFRSGASVRQKAAESGKSGGGRKTAVANSYSGMTLQEAKQILNVDRLDSEFIQKRYDHLFKINDKASGGSFYLQSKVYRAKERIDMEMQNEKEKVESTTESEEKS